MFLKSRMSPFTEGCSDKLREALCSCDSVVIGAGAGLSAAAGFSYSGERFEKYFADFGEKYHFTDMYTGGFYPYETPEEFWAYWSRYIFINRYTDTSDPLYKKLYRLVKDRDYFVLTTNVDHQFQKAGFDKDRLFYTQGDFGLFQCSGPCHNATYDNEKVIREMYEKQENMRVPSELIPHCPKCGRPMIMNLRADDNFVEDEGWHKAAKRYSDFLTAHSKSRTLYLELGVGYNTPAIIKFPFWKMTAQNPDAIYACINFGEAYCPDEIAKRSVCINGDIGTVLYEL